MTNETEITNFSSKMTEAAKEAVKSFTHNLTRAESSLLGGKVSHGEESNNLDVLVPEISTTANVVTEKAETLATSAIRKLVTTTISTSTSMSSNHLSDTSSSSFLPFGHRSSYPSNSLFVTDIPISTVPTTTATTYEIHDSSETVINNASEELTTASYHPGHEDPSAHQSMQNHIQNLNSPKSIKYLIEVSKFVPVSCQWILNITLFITIVYINFHL